MVAVLILVYGFSVGDFNGGMVFAELEVALLT